MKQRFYSSHWPLVLFGVLLLAVLFVATSIYRQKQQQQTELVSQISQTIAMLAIEPLKLSQTKRLDAMLHTFKHSEMMDIQALAILDLSLQMVSFSAPVSYPSQELPSLLPTVHQLFVMHQLDNGNLLAIQAIPQFDMTAIDTVAPAAVINGYVLLQFEALPWWQSDFWSPLLLLILLAFIWTWLCSKRKQEANYQRFVQWLQLLKPEQAPKTFHNAELRPLAQAVQMKLQSCYDEFQLSEQRAQSEYHQLQQQLQQQVNEQHQICVELAKVVQHGTAHQQQLKFWLELAEQLPMLSEQQVRYQIHILQQLHTLAEHPTNTTQSWHQLPDWLATAQRQLITYAITSDVELILEEDPHAYQYRLQFDAQAVTNLWMLFVNLCCQYATESYVSLSCRLLDGPQKQLRLAMKYQGAGFPLRLRQIIGGQVVTERHYQDANAELIKQLLRQVQGYCSIESLQDLGCQIDITIPVGWQSSSSARICQSVLLFDEKSCRAKVLKQSLAAIGEQVHVLTSLDSFTDALKTRLVDLLVVVLPSQLEQLEKLSPILQQLSTRYQLVCLAKPEALAVWQTKLAIPILPLPLLLADLTAQLVAPQLVGNQHLLVVEDNLTNVSFVKAMLAGEQLTIDIAMTGAEALKMASHNRYQLILMDIQLPDIGGIEVTKRIRQLKHHQNTVILAFTAHALSDEIAQFKLAGMDDVLLKPLDASKIASIMSRLKRLSR